MGTSANTLFVTLALLGCGDSSPPGENQAKPQARSVDVMPPAAPPPAANVEPALAAIVATCSQCESGVEVRRKGKPYWEPVAIGGLFRDGDWIRTGATASARIRFVSGGHLDLDAATTLFVEATAATVAGGESVGVRVGLEAGGASGVLDGASDAPILIRTKEGEVRISAAKGKPPAEFRLEPATNGAVEVVVRKGELVVSSGTDERRMDAEPTPESRPKPKLRPAARAVVPVNYPKSIAPKIDARFRCTKQLRIQLTWQAMPGAIGYRIVIARDMSFRSIVSSNMVKEPRFTLLSLKPGMYAWRVSAKDARGKYGESGFARRIFCDVPN